MTSEIWVDIENCKNYQISNYGRVRKIGIHLHWPKPKYLKLPIKNNYRIVNLYGKSYLVHRLVAIHFIKRNEFNLVLHIDGNSLNNRFDNLKSGNHKENSDDKMRHGRASKLNEAVVLEIRKKYLEEITIKKISEIFCVPYFTAYHIVKNKSWRHLCK